MKHLKIFEDKEFDKWWDNKVDNVENDDYMSMIGSVFQDVDYFAKHHNEEETKELVRKIIKELKDMYLS
jgi:ABC-type siderophore export system fused ATPase/permease subunit